MADNVARLTDEQLKSYLDVGHQGDADYAQIDMCLRMTPLERLLHHEPWRQFLLKYGENQP